MVANTSTLKFRLQTRRRLGAVSVMLGAFVLASCILSASMITTAVAQTTTGASTAQSTNQGWAALVPSAQKIGEGQLRRWGFLVYDATLWSTTGRFEPDQPFALSLTYARSISRDQIVDASLDQMRELGVDVDQHPEWAQALREVFVDVNEGDTLTGVHRPGEGAVFFAGDRLTGQIDQDLSQAFFAIWLDPDTTAPDLRLALLGKDQ